MRSIVKSPLLEELGGRPQGELYKAVKCTIALPHSAHELIREGCERYRCNRTMFFLFLVAFYKAHQEEARALAEPAATFRHSAEAVRHEDKRRVF